MKFLSIEFESSSRIKEKVEDLLTLEIVVPKKSSDILLPYSPFIRI